MRELDELRIRTGNYPAASSVAELQRLTRRNLPPTDAWGGSWTLRSSPRGYTPASHGLCGEKDPEPPAPKATPYTDILVSNGSFVQAPSWYREGLGLLH